LARLARSCFTKNAPRFASLGAVPGRVGGAAALEAFTEE